MLATLCVGLAGGVTTALLFALFARTVSPARPESSETPYIFARLKIEPTTDSKATLRLLAENGKIPVRNVRISVNAPGFKHIEYARGVTRTLAPGGKLSHLINPFPVSVTDYSSTVVEIYFDANISGVEKQFISYHRFVLQPDVRTPQTIDPETSNYKQGILPPPDTGQIRQQLAQAAGTVFITLREKTETRDWNVVTLDNAARSFVFDPQMKSVSFRTKTASGREVALSQPIQSNENHRHTAFMLWNAYGGSLGIDGHIQEDFDEGHKP